MAKDQLYPYAVARIRMLENSLLTEKQYLQMIEAPGTDNAIKILNEAGYGAKGESITVKNYESVLLAQLTKAYGDVSELVSGENFMDVFLLKNDYHNLKVLMKSELSGSDGSKYLVGGGTVDVGIMANAFQTKNMEALPWNMSEAVSKAYEAYGKHGSGQMMDIVLDKAAFRDMQAAADSGDSVFIKRYMEYLCDTTNLKGFLRIKKMKKPFEIFCEIFVDGGNLNLDVFRKAFSEENPGAGFRTTQYGALCECMAEGFTKFEKKCDDYIMAYIKEAKYKSLTVEPMIAYVYAKETEVKTLRIILKSKTNNIDTDVIKERLRDAYV